MNFLDNEELERKEIVVNYRLVQVPVGQGFPLHVLFDSAKDLPAWLKLNEKYENYEVCAMMKKHMDEKARLQ